MAIELNRGSEGVVLPKEVSSEIWAETVKDSAVMTATRQIALPGSGVTIPIITGEPEAEWVAETDEKPISEHTLANKSITPYKLAVIELFSDEFRRDLAGLYGELVRRLPYALGKAFDATVLGNKTVPGQNFDTLSDATSMAVGGTDVYKELVGVYNAVAAGGGNLSHWLASPTLQGQLLAATDGFGRPLFTPDATQSNVVGTMLGRPIVGYNGFPAAATGVAGDFAGSAVWGSVEGIKVAINTEGAVVKEGQTISLFQRNMFAVRAEIEVGFRVVDKNRFVKITDGTPADGTPEEG